MHFLGRACLLAASTTQGDLFQEEYGYSADQHNHRTHNEDIVYASRQTHLHGLDDLVEHHQACRALLRSSRSQLRLYSRLEQYLWVSENAQELRHLRTSHRRLLDGTWQRALEGGQLGRIHTATHSGQRNRAANRAEESERRR